MKRRYDNDFSYEFLDRIQEEYQCCDQAWYSANLPAGKLPLSCYQPDGLYTIIYEQVSTSSQTLQHVNLCCCCWGATTNHQTNKLTLS